MVPLRVAISKNSKVTKLSSESAKRTLIIVPFSSMFKSRCTVVPGRISVPSLNVPEPVNTACAPLYKPVVEPVNMMSEFASLLMLNSFLLSVSVIICSVSAERSMEMAGPYKYSEKLTFVEPSSRVVMECM